MKKFIYLFIKQFFAHLINKVNDILSYNKILKIKTTFIETIKLSLDLQTILTNS